MIVFVDTSALYTALDQEDERHERVAETFRSLAGHSLLTHNYVIAESAALVERRLGKERVRDLVEHLTAPIDVIWIDESVHDASVAAYLAMAGHGPSLVDCASFEVMRRHGIERAFALDRDFTEGGFDVIPE